MKTPTFLLLGSLLLLGPPAGVTPEAAVAAEAPDADPQAPDTDPQAPATPSSPTTPAASVPERSGTRTETLETFAPTEKVPADSAISFPVDI